MTARAARDLALGALFGALTGIRSFSGPAFVSRRLARERARKGLGRQLRRPGMQRALGALAAGEMVADKTPVVPARTEPGPLAGRAVLGGLAGLAASRSSGRGIRIATALVGAGAAAGAAVLAYRLRREAGRRLAVPDPLLGAAEDAIVLGVGAMVSAPRR